MEAFSKVVLVVGPDLPLGLAEDPTVHRILLVHTPLDAFQRARLDQITSSYPHIWVLEAPPIFVKKNLIGRVDLVISTLPTECDAMIARMWPDQFKENRCYSET